MHVERLELRDFRSYSHVEVAFEPGIAVLVGANAQGKTNLLEALHYLAVGSSHRVSTDAPLVRAGADHALVRAAARPRGVAGAGRRLLVELELRPGGRNRARLNGQPRPRVREVIGHLRAVLFAPEDVTLVRGEPADRRRFLDDLLAQRRPAYVAARQEYERVLRQRNALLKQARVGVGGGTDSLPTWTAALVRAAAGLLAARVAVVHALAGPAQEAYRELAGDVPGQPSAGLGLAYELSTGRRVEAEPGAGVPDPAELCGELAAALERVAGEERERGLTLVGPHRDDLVVAIGDLPAKGFASQGETWSAALALRLASREVLGQVGDEPVVLLDDVFAELDEHRRARLAERCEQFQQVLVTTAVDADVPLAGPRYRVEAGSVRRLPPEGGSGPSTGAADPPPRRTATAGQSADPRAHAVAEEPDEPST